MSNPTAVVRKLWNYCHPARRDDRGLFDLPIHRKIRALKVGKIAGD